MAEKKLKEKLKEKKKEAEKVAKKKAEDEKAHKLAEAEAMKKLKLDAEREAAMKALKPKDGKKGREKLAGNKAATGNAASGNIGTTQDAFNSLIQQHVKEHFNIYAWQQRKNLVAIIYIELNPDGRLKAKKIVKRSRDPVYDSAVLQAVEESQPYPIPPDPAFVSQGINMEFRPE